MSTDALKGLVPAEMVLPAEYTDAVITLPIVVEQDPVRVVVPGLESVQAALSRGSVEMVKSYCGMWTRWLTQANSRAVSS